MHWSAALYSHPEGLCTSQNEPNCTSLCAQGHLPTNEPCNEISSFEIIYQYPELLLNILLYLLLNEILKRKQKYFVWI